MTNIIDLETETLPDDKNLQEALRRKRPDYIEKTRTREQDRRNAHAHIKQSISARSTPVKKAAGGNSSLPQAKAIYSKGSSRIPQGQQSKLPLKGTLALPPSQRTYEVRKAAAKSKLVMTPRTAATAVKAVQ